jgi:hypothetical protein
MSTHWYISKNQQQEGPFTWEELYRLAEAGNLGPADHIWTEGMTGWAPAGQVQGLLPATPTSTSQPGTSASYPAVPTRRRGRRGLIAIIIVLAVILVGGGFLVRNLFFTSEGVGTKTLTDELPEAAWSVIASDFSFEPEQTQLVRNMSTDLFASFPDNFEMQWWVFSYPGSVDAAYDTLFIPPGADAISPYQVPIEDILNIHLLLWEPEIEEVRGSAWLDEARATALAWKDKHQRLGEVNFTEETYPGAVDSGEENEDPFVTWSFIVASPIVDLDGLSLIEGTFLIISRFHYIY